MWWESELAGLSGSKRRGQGNWHRKGKDNLFNSWASVVKCPIVPPSATTNGPFSSFFSPLLSSLFVLSHTSSNVSGRINFSPSSLSSSSALVPLTSVPHLSPPVSSSLPSINFFLLPHLLSFPIQFFPTLPPPKCTHACLHTYTFPSFSRLSLSLCVSQALAVRYRLLQSVSFPCSMSSSRLGNTLTFSTLSQVLHHICSLISVMWKACPAPPCSHKVVMHHQLVDTNVKKILPPWCLNPYLYLSGMYSSTATHQTCFLNARALESTSE